MQDVKGRFGFDDLILDPAATGRVADDIAATVGYMANVLDPSGPQQPLKEDM